MTTHDRSEYSPTRSAETAEPEQKRTRVLLGVVCLWVVSITVPLGLFSAAHMAALPVAEKAVTKAVGGGSAWRIVHVLAEECPCSRSVLEYLEVRGAQEGIVEEVILLDGRAATVSRLRALDFEVSTAEAESFCTNFGSEGVPFFQVVNGFESPSYSGAYFDSAHRGRSGFLDLSIYSLVKGGGEVTNRPVFGCATSERLRELLDPLGLKY